MVAATEAVSPPPVSDAKTAVVVNGAEKPTNTTASSSSKAKKGKNQLRREKKKQKKVQASREGSVATESESESVCTHAPSACLHACTFKKSLVVFLFLTPR